MLHNLPNTAGCYQVTEGVYIGGEVQDLEEREQARMFVFYGYCLWRAKQLDGEVRSDLWRVEGPAEPTHIFGRNS